MRIRNTTLSIGIILTLTIYAPLTAVSQACSGHWVTNTPLTYQCIAGQQIGLPVMPDPPGCPINPIYTSLQTNTFIFDNITDDFFIDFNAFDAIMPGCPRMQIKINGIFYPLSASNLTELPSGTTCSGSVTNITITSDGYITAFTSYGQGRLIFSGVNASSITISTNDPGGGTVVANPCFELLPIQIKSFSGKAIGNCEVALAFESGIETNVRAIEIEGSLDGVTFLKLLELLPKGSENIYTVLVKNSKSFFYRLKINDFDGHFSHSEIIHIKNYCTSSTVRISPNPSAHKILVENVQRYDQLIIVDISGRKLLHLQAINTSTEMNIQQMSTGLYFLEVFRNNVNIETVKFLKK